MANTSTNIEVKGGKIHNLMSMVLQGEICPGPGGIQGTRRITAGVGHTLFEWPRGVCFALQEAFVSCHQPFLCPGEE